MNNKLQFKISSGLKNIIGRELITDDFIAIFELVKNSFDAHATEVEIEFIKLNTENAKIKISDNGKGMNYDDLINKWLFVAYSAKKDGTEDSDYRNKIQKNTYYAGAKGIGRFSCDKLGSKLNLISTKIGSSNSEQLFVDWDKFDNNSKDEFIDIDVDYTKLDSNNVKFEHGTRIEISNLRPDSIWSIEKLLKLRESLAKLINPFANNNSRPFNITIKADEFISYDESQSYINHRVNGRITNNLIEILKEKTIRIYTAISEDGTTLDTNFSNNGEWLFSIKEKNIEYFLLKNIEVELFYLNRTAKNNFTRKMGIRSGEYGSVFLYKNGIRIYPYGEPGVDPLQLDSRQQKKIGNFIGNSELIGRIEIKGENIELNETTSRGDGLFKNSTYSQLNKFFIEKIIEKLECYRQNITKYGIDLDKYSTKEIAIENLIKSIGNISDNDEVIKIDYNENLIAILNDSQIENANATFLINTIEKIAIEANLPELKEKIYKVKNTLDDALNFADQAKAELKNKEIVIKEIDSQNMFLKSLRSQDFDDLVSFLHHAGIYAQTINSYLKNITLKLNRNIEITKKDLTELIRIISFESNKILNITEFATKAKFKLKTEEIETDITNYICEYINNIVPGNNRTLNIEIKNEIKNEIKRVFKPIEINILIDNIITNARKANAKNLLIELYQVKSKLTIDFIDDGIGIKQNNLNSIFEFGFTTTDGSGIGLYHVKQIIENNKGTIKAIHNNPNGTIFRIEI